MASGRRGDGALRAGCADDSQALAPPAGPLLLIVLGIAAQTIWQVDRHGVGLVGEIDVQFRAVGVPELTRGEWLRLGELAFAMVFVLYAESYGSVRGFALMHGDRIYPNRELYALGLSNLVSGLFGGLPVGAGYSGTSANEAAGARSRMAAWAAALVVLMVVFTLLPLLAHTRNPCSRRWSSTP